jgi:hypothetical protein
MIHALARINFYPGRAVLLAHAQATARSGAQLLPTEKEAISTCYAQLAGLARVMEASKRWQAESREPVSAVLVA